NKQVKLIISFFFYLFLYIYIIEGLFGKEFYRVFDAVSEDLEKPRSGSLTNKLGHNSLITESRLCLVLSYLRRGQQVDALCTEYVVSPSYVTREFSHAIPILAAKCMFIKPKVEWPKRCAFENVCGAIDCTSHYRTRVHPHQIDYYRGDKKGFFLSAQLLV